MVTFHSTRLERTTTANISCDDISADLQAFVDATGIRNGLLVAAGQHTTTALVVNEAEERLLGDIERHFLALTPPTGLTPTTTCICGRAFPPMSRATPMPT